MSPPLLWRTGIVVVVIILLCQPSCRARAETAATTPAESTVVVPADPGDSAEDDDAGRLAPGGFPALELTLAGLAAIAFGVALVVGANRRRRS